MRNQLQDSRTQDNAVDQVQERTQREQAQRSKQALSNQGSQDRKPARTPADREAHAADRDHSSSST